MKELVAGVLFVLVLLLGVRELLSEPRGRAAPSPAIALSARATPGAAPPALRAAPASAPAAAPRLLERSATALAPVRETVAGPLTGCWAGPALVTWSASAEFEDVRWPGDLDLARLRAATVTCESTHDGRFSFAAAPEGAERGSVLWLTALGREARACSLPRSSAGGSLPTAAPPPERAAVRVRVVRAGEPVAGALVRHTLSYWEPGQDAATRSARRAFLREGRTGADGTLAFAPGAADNAFLAELEGERSYLWLGQPAGELTLELLPTVRVAGRVVSVDPGLDLGGARVHFGACDAEDLSDVAWAGSSHAVRADGTFGPTAWPLADRTYAAVRLSGGELVPALERLPAPRPHAELELLLHARRGHPYVVAVTTRAGDPLPDARVVAHHWDGSAWTAAQQTLTDAEGRATVQVPAGELALEVEKPGFTSVTLAEDSRLLAPLARVPQRVVLRPSGVVEGWVRIGSEPVRAFSLCAWNQDRSYYRLLALEHEEGWFRLEDVPRGETVFLTAFTVRDPQSRIETIVLDDEPAEVELELPPARRARGRVVDAVTGTPLASARVQHMISGMNAFVDYRGSELAVAADGTFDVAGVYPGRGGLAFSADGYEKLFFSVREDDEELLDVGLVAMNPLATVEVVVRDGGSGDFAGYRAWNESNGEADRLALDARGRVSIPSRSGHYSIQVARPDGVVGCVTGDVRAGEHVVVELDFAAGLELVVTLAPAPPDVAAWRLAAASRADGEDRTVRAPWSEERAAFVLPRLTPGPVTLELRDEEDELVTLRTLVLSDAPQQTLALTVGGTRHRVRLVDGRGRPWSSRPVALGLEQATGWSQRLQTDAAGELVLGPLDATRVLLFAKLGGESIAYGIPVALEAPPTTTVVTLEPGPRCLLRLHEQGRPLAGIYVHFTHALAPRDLRFFYISDESGSVRGPFLAGGEHRATVDHPDYWPLERAVQPTRADEPLALELHRRATLAYAVERGGQPVAGARFDLRHVELDADADGWLAAGLLPGLAELTSDADGLLTLVGVPRGTYRWSCDDGSGTVAHGTTTLAGAGAELVRVRLAPR